MFICLKSSNIEGNLGRSAFIKNVKNGSNLAL